MIELAWRSLENSFLAAQHVFGEITEEIELWSFAPTPISE